MDPRLLRHFEAELRHIREMGAEFARDFPKIAGRLGLEGFACADPYVERLLEGYAFLAARVQLKMDSEFPQLVQNICEIVYPHLLAPTPSMAIVQFQPDPTEGALTEGYTISRGTSLRGKVVRGEHTACEYRTAHEVTLWPLEIVDVKYFSRDAVTLELPRELRSAEAGLRIRLRVAAGHEFGSLAIERLCFYLAGREELPIALYEQCVAHAAGVLISPVEESPSWQASLSGDHVNGAGFRPDEALLPYGAASFQGYRLLNEYFALRERFQFVEIRGIGDAFRRCKQREIDVTLLFDRTEHGLGNSVDRSNLELFCTPASNLFRKRLDPVQVDSRRSEHHIVPDRTRPLDLEVYQVTRVVGLGANSEEAAEFHPFYSLTDRTQGDARAYYAIRRAPRVISTSQQKYGTRTSYLGSEVFVSLVDRNQAPHSTNLQLLSVEAYCTHRDLPLQMPIGVGTTDFSLETGAPVNAVRCITGPTPPRPSLAHAPGETVWKLLSHLSLNYLSITGENPRQGASALREMLRMYADTKDATIQKQIDGVALVESQPIVRRIPSTGPMSFGRGLEITLTLDEEYFEGVGVFLLATVLEQFFAKYVSINSFTETVLRTTQRQEIMRWPTRIGRRHTL
ncbi:type VI secretion system baseplate subunit TssF [Pirellulales bacterium]|nr:type VI secretion system baseplate subunit TssF [Pirellulales bacterium]